MLASGDTIYIMHASRSVTNSMRYKIFGGGYGVRGRLGDLFDSRLID